MQEPVETTELQYRQEHSAKNGPFLGPLTSRSLLFPHDCSPIPHLVVCSAPRRFSIPPFPTGNPEYLVGNLLCYISIDRSYPRVRT